MSPHPNEATEQSAPMRFPIQTLDQLKPLLQGFRRHAGMTQAQLADKLGITQQSYAQIEAHPERASVERLFVVLALMGVELQLDGHKMDLRLAPGGGAKKKLVAPPAAKRPPGDTTTW